jgi:Lon protease-like protein
MNDIQESDGLFGLVMSDPNGDICEYGTVLKNTERKLFIDGRQLCFNKARSRFKVLEIVQTEPYMIVKADIDILDDEVEAAQITGIVPQNIIALEKEIWQCFQDTVNLSNKILKSTDEFRIDGPVKDLSPSSVVLRLNVATDFSFAIAEMLDLNYNERQALLQCLSLTNRLEIIRKYLNDLRNVLLSKVSNSLEDPFN